MPFPMTQRCGKVDQYQIYALSMAGTKRKLITTADDSLQTGNDISAQAPSKKTCHNSDGYNPKYMAHMCLGAHLQRIHAAGMASYPWHVEEDYRQDLTCMFAHAHSKDSFRQDTAARHMIPRLAGIAPRSRKDKTATVKEFIKHYDTVKEDLLLIQDILSRYRQGDRDFVTSLRNCVATLHVTLLGSPQWRTIIPYTPLPKACLPMLRNIVVDPKQSHFLSDFSDHISDMESWLNLPAPFVEVPTRLTASVIDKLQQHTERSSGKAEASPSVQSSSSTAPAANTGEQRTKQINLLEERLIQVNLLAEQQIGQTNLLKEQLEQAMADQARLTDRVKTLELAAAGQTAKDKLNEKAWVTTAELEKEVRSQITQQKSEIDRLNSALSAEQNRNDMIEAQRNNKIDQLNAALSVEQERSASIEANAARVLAQATDRMEVSIGVPDSSTLTTNNNFSEIASFSDAISSKLADLHANIQPHAPQQLTTPAIHQDLPIVMEFDDDCKLDDSEMDVDPLMKTNLGSVLHPNLLTGGQLNRFEQSMTNDTAPQPHLGQHKVSKEVCRDFKLGRCRYGNKCRFAHKACRRWLRGNCNRGENCYRSHDLFFLKKSNSHLISKQILSAYRGTTNNASHANPNSMMQERQVHDVQPSMQTSWATSSARKAPKAFFTRRIIKHSTPDTPIDHLDPFWLELKAEGSLVEQLALPDSPIDQPDLMWLQSKAGDGLVEQLIEPDLSEELNKLSFQKKQACKNHLKNLCVEGQNCEYTHTPCSYFMKGACKFTDRTCNNSHDPLFMTQGGVSKDRSSQPKKGPDLQSSVQRVHEIIRPKAQFNLHHLDELIRVAGKTNNKPAPAPMSDTPCRWQKGPAGCTNSRCEYKHDPPKATAWLN